MKRIEEQLFLFASTPILLVWGMQDPVLPPPVLRWWETRYPQAATCEVEDASHFLQEDAPEQIVGRIAQFLDSRPSRDLERAV
jgi:haloalkane dehalogenase